MSGIAVCILPKDLSILMMFAELGLVLIFNIFQNSTRAALTGDCCATLAFGTTVKDLFSLPEMLQRVRQYLGEVLAAIQGAEDDMGVYRVWDSSETLAPLWLLFPLRPYPLQALADCALANRSR